MSNYVTIANAALDRIGAKSRISSPDDNRFAARTIKGQWDLQRQAAIRDGAWNFASRRAELAAEYDPDKVTYPWAYAFPVPAESLRFIECLELRAEQYQYEDFAVLTDTAGPLRIRYLVDVDEPARWDAGFADSFALRLAWRCGRRIAGSAFDLDQCWQDYKGSLSGAKRVDARENPGGVEQAESSWVEARFAGGAVYPGRGW